MPAGADAGSTLDHTLIWHGPLLPRHFTLPATTLHLAFTTIDFTTIDFCESSKVCCLEDSATVVSSVTTQFKIFSLSLASLIIIPDIFSPSFFQKDQSKKMMENGASSETMLSAQSTTCITIQWIKLPSDVFGFLLNTGALTHYYSMGPRQQT